MNAMRRRPIPTYLAILLSCISYVACAADKPLGPFTFCYGLERGGDPAVFAELGLNTLYIDLQPSDIGDLEPCRQMIREAQRRGLKVIVGLPTCLTAGYRVSPWDDEYSGSVSELITHAVNSLKDEQGLSAWATGHALEKSISYSDADFRSYLQIGYPTLEALNASWETRFGFWNVITMQVARETDAARPFKVGRAATDLADYQARAYHDVMAGWLRSIKAADPQRPVLTGRITLYRSLLSIPDGYDVVCVSMPPDVVEGDLVAHNTQGLDMARRGGKFQVLQILRVPSTASPAYADESLRAWIQQAALHGSAGFGLEEWPMLEPTYTREKRYLPASRRLTKAITACRSLDFGVKPQANAAIVYSPYAEGMAVTGQPLYGHIRNLLTGEPSDLAYALRTGTRFGVVDYLSVEDLVGTELSRYGTLLLPACLKLPTAAEVSLEDYVQLGGAVVADLGLGMYETGSWEALPEGLMKLLGITQMGSLKDRAADLTAATVPMRALPLPPALKSHGTFNVGGAQTGAVSERKTFSIGGPVAEVKLREDAVPVATASVRFDPEDRLPIFAGLVGRQQAGGLALFATHALWQYWPLGDTLSTVLHGSLLARRARFELVQEGLLTGAVQITGSDDDLCLLNLGRQPVTAEVLCYGAASHAFSGAVSRFEANPLQAGRAAGTAYVSAVAPAQSLSKFARAGLIVQPYERDAAVQMLEYGSDRVSFRITGAGGVLGGTPTRGLELHTGSATAVRLILATGRYPVTPGSAHLVTTHSRGGRETQTTVTANAGGELDLSGTFRLETLTISPAR
ncbi:MAG: hypothetical protein ACM3VW_03640 [Bacteroidota bacterium]